MKSIDWGTAPSGATHYNTSCIYPWLKESPPSYFDSGVWVEYNSDCAYRKYHFDKAVKRPQEMKNEETESKEWDGSGVPPVGTVCEYRLNECSVWFECKIVYVLSGSDDCFVAWCEHLGSDQSLTFLASHYKLQLRKIKTPEQIAAAEKRQQAVNDMIELVAGDSSFNEVMSLLYDGGYRITGMEK